MPLQVTVMCLVEPGAFREMHSFVQKSCDGSGRLEVISLAATEDVPSVHAAPAHDSLPGVPGGPRAAPEPSQQASPAVSSSARQALSSSASPPSWSMLVHLLSFAGKWARHTGRHLQKEWTWGMHQCT